LPELTPPNDEFTVVLQVVGEKKVEVIGKSESSRVSG
jgi:hypothetical protein